MCFSDFDEPFEQYLETYWGQATLLERLITLLVASGHGTPAGLQKALGQSGLAIEHEQAVGALRMLELYGVLSREGKGFSLRARWFPIALQAYGAAETLIDSYVGQLA